MSYTDSCNICLFWNELGMSLSLFTDNEYSEETYRF